MRKPVALHGRQIRIGELSHHQVRFRALNRDLRIVVAEVSHAAIELARVVAHPGKIFFARTRVNHQQVVVFAQAMHDHIVHKRPLRIEQRGILRLTNRQLCSVIHTHMLHRGQRLRACQANVAHVANIKDADTRADRHVLGDQAARAGIFDRHIPSVEGHHLRAHLAVDGVQRRLANYRNAFDYGQDNLNFSRNSRRPNRTYHRITRIFVRSTRGPDGQFLAFPTDTAGYERHRGQPHGDWRETPFGDRFYAWPRITPVSLASSATERKRSAPARSSVAYAMDLRAFACVAMASSTANPAAKPATTSRKFGWAVRHRSRGGSRPRLPGVILT